MATQGHPELIGIHTNMAGVIPPDIDKLAQTGAPAPSDLSADEKVAYERLKFVYAKGVGYGYQLGLRPQSMYGMADSPVGLAAYFMDHDARSLELISRAFDGQPTGLTRDDFLDNITFTWLTNTGVSSGRLYWENTYSYFGVKGVSIPVAVSVFPDELYPAPRSWAERAYPKLIHYNRLARGRALCGLGTAEALRGRAARGTQVVAYLSSRAADGARSRARHPLPSYSHKDATEVRRAPRDAAADTKETTMTTATEEARCRPGARQRPGQHLDPPLHLPRPRRRAE